MAARQQWERRGSHVEFAALREQLPCHAGNSIPFDESEICWCRRTLTELGLSPTGPCIAPLHASVSKEPGNYLNLRVRSRFPCSCSWWAALPIRRGRLPRARVFNSRRLGTVGHFKKSWYFSYKMILMNPRSGTWKRQQMYVSRPVNYTARIFLFGTRNLRDQLT